MILQDGLVLVVRKCYEVPRYEIEQLLIIHSIQGGIFHIDQDKFYDCLFFPPGSNLREAYLLVIFTPLVNETVESNLLGKRIDVNDWSSATRAGLFETLDKMFEAFTHNIVGYLILLSQPVWRMAVIDPATYLNP